MFILSFYSRLIFNFYIHLKNPLGDSYSSQYLISISRHSNSQHSILEGVNMTIGKIVHSLLPY